MKKLILSIFIISFLLLTGCNYSFIQEEDENTKLYLSNELSKEEYSIVSDKEELKKQIMNMSIQELKEFSSLYKCTNICSYYFIDYTDDLNIVVKIKEGYKEIEAVNIYESVSFTKDVISKIQYGMSIEEVVEMIGNPLGSFTFGILSLSFKIDETTNITIQLDEDLIVLAVNEY